MDSTSSKIPYSPLPTCDLLFVLFCISTNLKLLTEKRKIRRGSSLDAFTLEDAQHKRIPSEDEANDASSYEAHEKIVLLLIVLIFLHVRFHEVV